MYTIALGYDNDFKYLAYVAAESIVAKSSIPLQFIFLNKNNMKSEYTRPRGEYDSTEFSNSRFATPYLSQYAGWTLFMDNDVVVDCDIKEVFDFADDQYSVMCVQHNQVVDHDIKFLGHVQTSYDRKNWSSVMLFNNAKCRDKLSIDYVNTAPGLDLHQFKWCPDDEIGSIPLEYNYLVGNKNQTDLPPKIYHYTEGGPYFRDTKDCPFSSRWTDVYERFVLSHLT